MSSIISRDGRTITDHKDILQECRRFYEDLYESKEQEETPLYTLDSIVEDLDLPKLTQEGKEALDSPLTAEELRFAAGKLNHNKCPGTDRLPQNFTSDFGSGCHLT